MSSRHRLRAFLTLPNVIRLIVTLVILIWLPLRGTWPFLTSVLVIAGATVFGLVVQAPEWFRDKIAFLSLMVFFAGFYLGPRQITKIGFYEGTAQIVPVLFIALAVEVRFFRFRDMDETDRRSAGITALTLILTGYQSLKVLANGDPRVGDAQLTVGALVAATTALALSALVWAADSRNLSRSGPERSSSPYGTFRSKPSAARSLGRRWLGNPWRSRKDARLAEATSPLERTRMQLRRLAGGSFTVPSQQISCKHAVSHSSRTKKGGTGTARRSLPIAEESG
jgi:hypothetical protein